MISLRLVGVLVGFWICSVCQKVEELGCAKEEDHCSKGEAVGVRKKNLDLGSVVGLGVAAGV